MGWGSASLRDALHDAQKSSICSVSQPRVVSFSRSMARAKSPSISTPSEQKTGFAPRDAQKGTFASESRPNLV